VTGERIEITSAHGRIEAIVMQEAQVWRDVVSMRHA
jgi:hypothetical protein